MNHPMQPVYVDDCKTPRFKENAIVRYLIDAGPFSHVDLIRLPFTNEDREQFAQLVGYSLCGFSELDYVSDEAVDRAYAETDKPDSVEACARHAEQHFADLLERGIPQRYGITPDHIDVETKVFIAGNEGDGE